MKLIIKAILVGVASLSLWRMGTNPIHAQQCDAGQYCPPSIQHPTYGGVCHYVSGVCAASFTGITTSSCGGTPCTFDNLMRICEGLVPGSDPPECRPGQLVFTQESCCVGLGTPTPTPGSGYNPSAASMYFLIARDADGNGEIRTSPYNGRSEISDGSLNCEDYYCLASMCTDDGWQCPIQRWAEFDAGATVRALGVTRSLPDQCRSSSTREDCCYNDHGTTVCDDTNVYRWAEPRTLWGVEDSPMFFSRFPAHFQPW